MSRLPWNRAGLPVAVLLSLGTTCDDTQTEAFVQGTVATAAGDPVENASIEATLLADCASPTPLGRTARTVTDADGWYESRVVSDDEQPQEVCVAVDAEPPESLTGWRGGSATGSVVTASDDRMDGSAPPIVTVDVTLPPE